MIKKFLTILLLLTVLFLSMPTQFVRAAYSNLVLYPSANGATHTFSASAGQNWSCVSANDSSYVYRTSTGGPLSANDTYVMDDLPAGWSGIISSLTVNARIRGTDGEFATAIAIGFLIDGVSYSANSTSGPGSSYIVLSRTYTTNPKTGLSWTAADINNLQTNLTGQTQSMGSPATIAADCVWLVVTGSSNEVPETRYSGLAGFLSTIPLMVLMGIIFTAGFMGKQGINYIKQNEILDALASWAISLILLAVSFIFYSLVLDSINAALSGI